MNGVNRGRDSRRSGVSLRKLASALSHNSLMNPIVKLKGSDQKLGDLSVITQGCLSGVKEQ